MSYKSRIEENPERGVIVLVTGEDGFEMPHETIEGLFEVLSEKFPVKLSEKLEGPSERVWTIDFEGQELVLADDFDDWIEIYSLEKSAGPILSDIGAFLEKRLRIG